MTTISASTTVGIVLNPTTDTNPIVIEAVATITNDSGNAVSGNHGASGYFVVQNYGTISADSTSGIGIYLSPGGSVTNAASASITGDRGVGVYGGTGTVVNNGSIAGSGTRGIAVVLNAGGSVSNGTAASMTGFDGVSVLDGLGTVVNSGGIAGAEFGVYLFSGGSISNAGAASITGYSDGVLISVGAGTVVNHGSIAGTAASGIGVQLNSGGLVTNAATASMSGAFGGVAMSASGTVSNYGNIAATGTAGNGVLLNAGGSVSNATAAVITGAFGIAAFGGAATVANSGSITSSGTYARGAGAAGGIGVYLGAGGSVTNAASASIVGSTVGIDIFGGTGTVVNDGVIAAPSGYGVELASGGTLTDAGTIDAATAVLFGGTGSNLLVLDPGFSASGAFTGSSSAANTLELAAAASAGTLGGLGTEFTNFGSILFDAGADWSITGNTAGLAGTISGFAVGDTIELDGVTKIGTGFVGHTLTLTETVGFATLDLPGISSITELNVTSNVEGTEVTVVPCFAAGTRIACVDGERAVETLAAGDLVCVAGADRAAITWIGHRHVDCDRHPRPENVWPVRVHAGAFAAGVPHRDLLLSPDHAVFLDGALIPIRYLINGRSIVQQPVDRITYYHVELSSHAVILAEGLPCESYLDTGNRGAFANGDGAMILHPDFARQAWQTTACAELVVAGPKLAAAKRVVLARARMLGHRLSDDPDLRVVVDGYRLRPAVTGNTWRVRLPPAARGLRFVSRALVPAHVLPDNDDMRSLGVAIANIRLDGRTLSLDDPRLGSGWHVREPAGWRWTDGNAWLSVTGIRELAFDVVISGSYWEASDSAAAAAV